MRKRDTTQMTGKRLAEAFHLLEMDQVNKASDIFQHELALDPNQHDCLVGMALVHYKHAELPRALDLINQVLEADPHHPLAVRYAGIIHFELGEFTEAKPYIEQLVKTESDPHHFRNLAYISLTYGDFDQAIHYYEASLTHDPHFQLSLLELAQLRLQQNAIDKAIALYDQLLSENPTLEPAITGYALCLTATGDVNQALEWLENKQALMGPNPALLTTRAHILYQVRKPDEAKQCLELALTEDAKYVPALLSMANLLYGEGDLTVAELYYHEIINVGPNLTALINLANIAIQRNQYLEAKRYLGQALTLAPDSATALSNLGTVYHNLGDYQNEADCYKAALTHYANHKVMDLTAEELFISFQACKYNFARLQLLQCDWENGYINLEARKHLFADLLKLIPNVAYYNGTQDLNEKNLYLLCESEISDTLACIRFAPVLKRLGAKTHLLCPPSLASLLATVPGIDQTLDAMPKRPLADSLQVSVVDLPFILAIDPNHMEEFTPYITADGNQHLAFMQQRIPNTTRHIGICPSTKEDFGYRQFDTLCNQANTAYYALGTTPSGITLARANQWVTTTGSIHDYATLASLLTTLDLVITVDGPVAHLCGALQIPCWILLPFVPHWRWQLNRSDSPWYPSVRLFRQPKLGDWDSVLIQVNRALTDYKSARGTHG